MVQTTIFEAVNGGMCCVALSVSNDNVLMLPGDGITVEYIFERVTRFLKKGGRLSCLNMKEIAGYVPEEVWKAVFDVFIAAYLCNPLKEAYTDVDIARDYLSATVPEA